MKKYSYAKKLLHYHSFLADNECTKDYPFAYLNGQYCCETNKELVSGGSSNEIASGTCDGIGFNIESTCCKDNKYLKCPHEQCVTRHEGIRLCKFDTVLNQL